MINPINKLFVWNADCRTTFETLKVAMMTAPTLSLPNDNVPYVLGGNVSYGVIQEPFCYKFDMVMKVLL